MHGHSILVAHTRMSDLVHIHVYHIQGPLYTGAGAGPCETRRHSIGGVVSKTSRTDFAIYTLGRGSGQTKVVAIIDAKNTLRYIL